MTTVNLSVVTTETLKITETSATNTNDVLLRGSEAKLAQFIVKPSNSANSARFDSFVFWGTYSGSTTSGAYDVDALEVTLGSNELECYATGTDQIMCDVNEDITSAGATITIKLTDASNAEGLVEIEVTELNETPLTTPKTFEKEFLDIVVRVVKQEIKKATTVYTLSVEIADDYDFEPNYISFEGDVAFVEESWVFGDEATITLPNGVGADLISEVVYKDSNGVTYTINKGYLKDYFKNIPTTYLDGKSWTEDLMVANAD